MGRLHMSEDTAFRRIQVARVALRFPEVFELLADGRLGVTTAAMLVPHLAPETAAELLAAVAFRTKHEIQNLLAARSRPVAAAPDALAEESRPETSSSSLAPAQVKSLSDLCATPGGVTPSSHAPEHANNPRRGRVLTSPTGGHEVRLSLTDEEHEVLRRATALLGHAVPSGDPAVIYARAMQHYVSHLEKQRFGAKRGVPKPKPEPVTSEPKDVETSPASHAPGRANGSRGRGIPKALRHFVWERDGGSCAFVSSDGHRCGSTTRLEVDHITPVAMGGETTPDNLRLLCRAHNQYEAERLLGKDHVQRKRDMARFERAKAKAPARASTARAKVRDEALQARHDDLEAALLGLGFKKADALRGAALADAMPESPLDACLRHALTVLTRPVAARGERRARCTA
jgi:5-methylcytosine-specific restriction endonuclease McrA